MTTTVFIKAVMRGFWVLFVHLQAIERKVGMTKTAEGLDQEIELYKGYTLK